MPSVVLALGTSGVFGFGAVGLGLVIYAFKITNAYLVIAGVGNFS